MRFSKQLLSVLIDFIFLTLIFALVSIFVFSIRFLIYPDEKSGGTLIVATESIPLEFENDLYLNETVYDTLTKRKVGEIKEINKVYGNGRVRFIIKIDAKFKPKSESLRTKTLWFRYCTGTEYDKK